MEIERAPCEGVGAALHEATEKLAAAGCDQPRLDAELLLAHVLGVPRSYLYAHPERCLTPAEAAAWQAALARRVAREPVPYIVGATEFYGLPLVVDRRVLVPRPETELIVDRARALAAQEPLATVWDVGTGSGALALAIAQHLPGARVVASDVSGEALQVADLNRRRLGLEGHVQMVRCDLLACARGGIDLIVANLPYLRTEEYLGAMPEVSRYEPRGALDGGARGLDPIGRLLAQAAALRPAPAFLLLEIGAEQGAEVVAMARERFPERPVALWRDYAGLDRVVEIGSAAGMAAGWEQAPYEEPTRILPPTPGSIDLAAEALRRGEVVAFPTDTVYGIGAATFCEAAVQALYEVKGRPEVKAIPLLLAQVGDLGKVVSDVPIAAWQLARRYWPGPLTLVLEARPEIPAVVRAGGHTVAVRVPDHPVARALIEAVGAPLATTSANRSGAVEAKTAAEVLAQLGRGVRWIIDGGRSPGGTPSTVVDLTVDPPLIRRVGAIPEEELRPLLSP